MITPKEIHDKEFKRSMRGYDLDDVDQFLDRIIKDFEEMYLENANLKEEHDILEKKISHYVEMESSLNRALLQAEKTAEIVKMEAIVERDKILSEAKEKSVLLIDKARVKADSFDYDNRELIEKSNKFKNDLINLYEKQIINIKESGLIQDAQEVLGQEEEIILPETIFQEAAIADERDEDGLLPEYKEEFDNGLLDEEEEEFKNKVFKFLDK